MPAEIDHISHSLVGTLVHDFANGLSLTGSVLTFLIISTMIFFKSTMVNRVSLRLQLLVALAGIVRHSSMPGVAVAHEFKCQVVGFFISWSEQLYVCYNMCIAFNIHLIFIRDVKPDGLLQVVYIIVSTLFTGLVNMDLLALGQFGLNNLGLCNFAVSEYRLTTRMFSIYSMVPGIIYCGYVFLIVLWKLRQKVRTLKMKVNNAEAQAHQIEHIESLYFHVSLFPFSCFIYMAPYIFAMVMIDLDVTLPNWYIFTFRLLLRMSGLTNFIILMYDNHFNAAYRYLLKSIVNFFKRILSAFVSEAFVKYTPVSEDSEDTDLPFTMDDNASTKDWQMEYSDGKRMSLRDHVKYI